MPVPPDSISFDKCYLSNMNFVRHVVGIDQTHVTFEERGTKPVPLPWAQKAPVSLVQFSRDVTMEVPQDFDPELPGDNH